MKTRNKLMKEIACKQDRIKLLQQEVKNLKQESLLLSDKNQWFTEKEEEAGRGKKKYKRVVGRIHWNEDFINEDTHEVVSIERSLIVRVDGEWRYFLP